MGAGRVARTGSQRSPSPEATIVPPGRNCWRLDRAHRFYAVQDAADYFRLVRRALLGSSHGVHSRLGYHGANRSRCPDAAPSKVPTRFDRLLPLSSCAGPHLRCYILTWDYARALHARARSVLAIPFRLAMPRRVHFEFDDRHPLGGSHHQKVVVVDDQLAFCGGIDLTSHRWDTTAHRPDEPLRKTPTGKVMGRTTKSRPW